MAGIGIWCRCLSPEACPKPQCHTCWSIHQTHPSSLTLWQTFISQDPLSNSYSMGLSQYPPWGTDPSFCEFPLSSPWIPLHFVPNFPTCDFFRTGPSPIHLCNFRAWQYVWEGEVRVNVSERIIFLWQLRVLSALMHPNPPDYSWLPLVLLRSYFSVAVQFWSTATTVSCMGGPVCPISGLSVAS